MGSDRGIAVATVARPERRTSCASSRSVSAMSPCRLPFTSTARVEEAHGGDSADRAGNGMGLLLGAAVHPMETNLDGIITVLCRDCVQCGRCPGLRLQCEVRSCGWVAQRSRFTAPGGWQQHTPPIADYPLAGVTLRSGRLDQARLHSAALQPGPAECGREHRQGAVLMASSMRSRHDSGGRPRGLRRCLPGRINQNRLVLFKAPPAVSVLASRSPAAAGSGGRGNPY